MQPTFETELQVAEQGRRQGRTTWHLLQPLQYRSAVLGTVITVPAGFVTDFASVPRLPFTWLLAGGYGNRAAVVHDWLYLHHTTSRRRADKVFLEALRACGVARWRAWGMYTALRLCGWANY